MGTRLNGDDGARHGCVDGHAKSLPVSDLLTEGYPVANGYQRLTGRANVLGHGNADDMWMQGDNGRFARQFLVTFWMDTAEKRA